ncbi:mucin-19-like [Branchiostoma floridae]|uniref:Mucin-19-like n=1 Tax=Branchiostoma floridae TaxID=7739 RepID=A0A9J7LH55_BRAFL|nr:mucin-19-like [Branchiostoma floridae]
MHKDVMGASCTCVLASDWERNTMATQAESRIPTSVRRRSFLPQRKSLPAAEPAQRVEQTEESSPSRVTDEKKPTGIPSPSSSQPKRGLKPPAISGKQPPAQAEIPKKSVFSGVERDSEQKEKGPDPELVSKAAKKAKADRRRSGIPSLNFAKKNPPISDNKSKTTEETEGATVITAEELVLSQSAKNLELGNRVTIGGSKCGVLSYVGTVHFSQGEWCGIELDEPIGNHDGTVQGVRYFECGDKYGIFAAASKVELDGACGTTTEQEVKPKVYGKPPKHPSKLALPKYGRSSLQQPRQTIYATGPIARVFPNTQQNSADSNTSEAKENTGRVGKGKTSLFQTTRVSPIQERNVSPAWSNADAVVDKGETDEVMEKINTTVTLDSTFTSVSNNPEDNVDKLVKTGTNSSAMAAVQGTDRVEDVDVEPPTTSAQDEPQAQTDPEGAKADMNVADVDTMEIQLDTEERLHESLGSPESEMASCPPMSGETIPGDFQEDLPAEVDDDKVLDITDGQQQDSDMEVDRQNISYVVPEEKQHLADQPELTVGADGTCSSTPESQDTKSVDSLEADREGVTVVQAGIVEMDADAIPIGDVAPNETDELQRKQETGVPLPLPSHDGTFTKDANTTYTAEEEGPSQTLLPSRASSEYGTSSSGQDNSPDSLEEQEQGCGNKDNATFILDTAPESMDVEDLLSDIKEDESAIGAHGQQSVDAAGYISPFPDVILQVVSASEIGPVTDKTFTQAVDNVSYDPVHSILRLDELSMLPEISSENFLQEDVVNNVNPVATTDSVPDTEAAEGVNNNSNMDSPLVQTLESATTETQQSVAQSEDSNVEPGAITIQVTEPLEEDEDDSESSSDRAQVERLPESERESPTSNDLSSGNTISTDLDSGVGQGDKPPASPRESPTSDDLSLEDEAAANATETEGATDGKDVAEDSSQVKEEVVAPMPDATSNIESASAHDISTTEVMEDAGVTEQMVSSTPVEKPVDLSVEEEVNPPDAPQPVNDESPKPAVNEDKLPVDAVEPSHGAETVIVDAMGEQAAAATDAVADEAIAVEPQALEIEMLSEVKAKEKEDEVPAGSTVASEEGLPLKVAKVTDQTFEVGDVAEMDVSVHGAEKEAAMATFVAEDAAEVAMETEAGVAALELDKLDETFDPTALVTSTPFQHKEFTFSRIDPESPSFGTDHVHPLEGEDSLIVADVVRTLEPDIIDHAADNQHISGEEVVKTMDFDRKDAKKKQATRALSSSEAKSSISQGSQAKKARTTSLASTKQKAPARASVGVSKAADTRKTTAKAPTQFVSKLAVPRTSSKNQANAVAQQSKGTAGSRFKSDSSGPSEKAKSQPPSNTFKTPMGPSSKVGLVRPTPRASPFQQDRKTAADRAKEQPSSSSSTSSPAQRRRLSSNVSDKSDAAPRSTRTPGIRSATTTPQVRRASSAKESSRSTSGTSSATTSPAVRKRLSSSSELQRKNMENSPSRASSRSSSVSGSPVPKRMSSRTHINGHAAEKDQQRALTPTSTPRSDRSGTSTPTSTRSRSNSMVRSSPRPGSAASVGSVSSPRGQLKGVAARIDTGLKKRDSSTSLASTKSDGGKDDGTASTKEKSASQPQSDSKKRVQLRIIPARQILYGRLKLKKHSMRKNLLKLICGSNKDEKSGPRTSTNKAETKARSASTPSTSSLPSASQKKVPSSTQKKTTLTTLSQHVEETDKPTNRKHAEIQHSERNGHSKRRVSTSSAHSSASDLSVTSNASSRLSSSHEEARAQRARADVSKQKDYDVFWQSQPGEREDCDLSPQHLL